MSAVVSEMPNNYGHMISTHYNNHEQSLVQGSGALVLGGEATDELNDEDIDFSKAEAFLQLEAPIDARKDQNMLKLAYTIPKRTFMNRILRRYPIHKKRLAFIQRKPLQPKPLEVVGNLVVSAKGGDSKEVSISCQVCGQRFTKQHHFQRHLFIHPDPDNKKFLCQVCGKRFNRADHLNRHALLHGDVKVSYVVYYIQRVGFAKLPFLELFLISHWRAALFPFPPSPPQTELEIGVLCRRVHKCCRCCPS